MAQLSLLSQYATVTTIPPALRRLAREMKSNNACSLLSFLISRLTGNFPTAVLGQRHHYGRLVRLSVPLWWEGGCSRELKSEVSAFSVDSAIVALNARLKKVGLPYRVGRYCRNGDPRSHKFRPVAPYIICLVDIRRPLSPELSRDRWAV